MFFSSSAWSYGVPIAKGGYEGSQGLKEIYRQLAKQLGLTLFVPLVRPLSRFQSFNYTFSIDAFIYYSL